MNFSHAFVRRPGSYVAAPQLGDHPLEPLHLRRLEEGLALALHVGDVADPRVVLEHAAEQALAILERDVEQKPAVEVEQVERLVQETADARLAELGLEEREVRAAVLVDGHDLAVDDRLLRLDPGRWRQQAREVGLGVLETARPEVDLAAVDDGLDAEAVELDLVQPVRVAERRRGEGRQHRVDALGHRRP